MSEENFISRMEALGIVSPQVIAAECTLLRDCNESEKGAVCRFDVFNGGRNVNVAYVEARICGKIFKEEVPVLPGESMVHVLYLLDDVEYDDAEHPCSVAVFDYCDRAVASVCGDVFLRSDKASGAGAPGGTAEPLADPGDGGDDEDAGKGEHGKKISAEVSILDSVKLNGAVPVEVCSIRLETESPEGRSALVNLSIDGQCKYSTMMWASKDPKGCGLQVLPELFSGIEEAEVSIEVFDGLDSIFSQTKKVKVAVDSPKKQVPALTDNRSPLEVAVELDQSDYIVDVHDNDLINGAGCVRVARLELYSKESKPSMVDLDVMLGNRKVQSERKDVYSGYSSIDIDVPLNDLYNEESYQASLCVIVRDKDSKLISEPRRTVKIRSKFDMDLSKKEYLSARFVNPRAPCVDQIVKAVNQKGVSIDGYQHGGEHVLPQLEALVDAVCSLDIQYLSDTFTFGEEDMLYQRVRNPQKVYEDRSANCIEISLLFASVFEMCGLCPIIAFPTGHAMPGIIVASSKDYHHLGLPQEVPANIRDKLGHCIYRVNSEGIGLEPGFDVSFIVFEGTLAKSRRGSLQLVCDLGFLVERGSAVFEKDLKDRSENGKRPMRFCNIEGYRSKKVNPVLM